MDKPALLLIDPGLGGCVASPVQGDQGIRVTRSYGDALTALFAVKRRLDLEKMDTPMRYVERYAVERIESTSEEEATM